MDCDIIRDLLPLYVDGVCSEGTKKNVEEHLEQCSECREIYEMMTFEEEASDYQIDNVMEAQPFKKMKEKQKKKYCILVVLFLICLAVSTTLLVKNFLEKYNQLSFEVATGDFNEVLQRINEEIDKKWGMEEELLLELSDSRDLVFGPATGMDFHLYADGEQLDVCCNYYDESTKMLVYINRQSVGSKRYGISWNEFLKSLNELEASDEIEPQRYILLLQVDKAALEAANINIYKYEPEGTSINYSDVMKFSIPVISTEILE